MAKTRHAQIARLRRLERAMRRRSASTSTREVEPRVTDGPPPDPVLVVGVPVVVGACMYGQLVAFREVKERSGFEAFRLALSLQFPQNETRIEVKRFRQELESLGLQRFAASWHLLVAYVDRVGAERARFELDRGLFNRPVAH